MLVMGKEMMMKPRVYDEETKARTVRLVLDFRKDHPDSSRSESYRHVSGLTGIPVDTLRTWVTKHEINAGERPGVPVDILADNRRLQRENAELRRANQILKSASAFFAAELDGRK